MHSGGIFDFDEKSKRLNEVLNSLNDPSIWEDRELSQTLNQERSRLEKVLNRIETIGSSLEDAQVLLELAMSENDASSLEELSEELVAFEDIINQLEIQRMFSGEMDASNCFLIFKQALVERKLKIGLICFCECICVGASQMILLPN